MHCFDNNLVSSGYTGTSTLIEKLTRKDTYTSYIFLNFQQPLTSDEVDKNEELTSILNVFPENTLSASTFDADRLNKPILN